MRRALVLALLALSGCGGARPSDALTEPAAPAPSPAAARTTQATGESRAASPEQLATVHALMRETARLRGLPFLAPVAVSIEDRAAMRAYVERTIDDAQLEKARARYLALGLLEPDVDVHDVLVAVMEEELIGYYDPKQKRLAVRADIARALGGPEAPHAGDLTWRATVVHELVHALQDQHFALGERVEEPRTTDADNAFGALVEGDATLVMLAYAAEATGETLSSLTAQPARVLQLMTRAPEQLTDALRRAPALLREPLLFRYREGAHYCASLYQRGGWSQVDRAHRRPPTSTRFILAAPALLDGAPSPPERVDFGWLREHGYTAVDDDVLGPLELAIALAPTRSRLDLAASWRSDAYVVLEREGERGSLWQIEFADAHAARVALEGFRALGDPLRRLTIAGTRLLVARALDDETFAAASARLRAGVERGAANGRAPQARARGSKRGDPLATTAPQH